MKNSSAFCFLLVLLAVWAESQGAVESVPLSVRKIGEHAHSEYDNNVIQLVKEWQGHEVDTYIPLTKRQFLLLRDGGAPVANGIYLGDIESWTIEENPVVGGEPEIKRILKDKAGRDTALIHLGYSMRQGNSGSGFVLISAMRTRTGRVDIQVTHLGSETEGDFVDECRAGKKPGETASVSVAVSVVNANSKNASSIQIDSTEVACGSGEPRNVRRTFVSTYAGFLPESALLPPGNFVKHLIDANREALALHKKSMTHQSIELLEKSGVGRILFSKPKEMSDAAYFEVVNNYAFFLGGWRPLFSLEILDSILERAPRRTVAWLNRAEVLLLILRFQRLSPQEMVKYSEEISKNYESDLALEGLSQPFFEDFARLNLARYPSGMNVCSFIDQSGRSNLRWQSSFKLDYLYLRTRRLDLNNDGQQKRLRVGQSKYGRRHDSIAMIKADGPAPIQKLPRPRSRLSDYGFELLAFGGKIYLVYTDYVTQVRGAGEELVCEANREPVAHEAKDPALCAAVLESRIDTIRFGSTKGIEGWKVGTWTIDTRRRPGVETIDIDNDGKPKTVAAIVADNGVRFDLFAINTSPPALRSDGTNRLLIELQAITGLPSCRAETFSENCRRNTYWKVDPFRFANRIYIEKYHEDEFGKTDRDVVELRDGKINPMCRLGLRVKEWRAVHPPVR